ncbi:MAG: DEAD/DEAH box helicase [Methylobacteriaceae bacterium]|nr:DEAD/DEAH box helicase [Methylobacteriaceae bacterium]
MSNFSDLGLIAPILKALAAEGYETPTPIQAKAIPHLLAGRDILGVAQTGTGKTAAFALPILQHLAKDPRRPQPRNCRVLILSPTRELASQIEASFRTYGRFLRITSTVVFGGVPIGKQVRACAGGPDVVVTTPGRLLDLINQRALTLASLEVLVLDEADRMLDMGFIHDIRRIVALLPRERQSLFFSATMPKEIADLAARLLTRPVEVAVTPAASTVDRIAQQVIFCEGRSKQAVLQNLLQDAAIARALVFTRTKHGADRVVKNLDKAGILAEAIHGNKSQGQRERALAAFRSGRSRLLVATDIAARGIDVDGITHVINFDLPNMPESYVHRIGRTARAGADGIAISLCDREERDYLRDIERLIRQRVPMRDNPLGADGAAAPMASAQVAGPHGQRMQQNDGSGRGRLAHGPHGKGSNRTGHGVHQKPATAGQHGPRRPGRVPNGHAAAKFRSDRVTAGRWR